MLIAILLFDLALIAWQWIAPDKRRALLNGLGRFNPTAIAALPPRQLTR